MSESTTYLLRLPDGREFGPATIELMTGWAREGRVPLDGKLTPTDGGAPLTVADVPEFTAILQAPPTVRAPGPPMPAPTMAIESVVPFRNPPALIAYYLSIFALIPILGAPLGLAAVVVGIVGLRRRAANPAAKGTAHAWIGIILGGTLALVWGAMIVIGIVAAVNS